MNNEFKKSKSNNETRYVLENSASITTGAVATVPGTVGKVQKRGNILAQEAGKDKVDASKPRNFVAKNAKMGGAGAHKDKKKDQKQGNEKHKKPYMESLKQKIEDLKSKLNEAEGQQRMSRAAKGNEKYGKDGMKALAKAGREGASEKKLDAIRDRHDNYNEDSDPCWKDYKQIGMKKKGSKQVPNCVPKEGVAEGQLDEGAIETITALAKKIPGIGKYYQMAQQYKPQLIQILKTSKSGKEVKQKMEQLAAGQSATFAESGMMKQLGGLAVGGGSILSTMWMNAMGMIDGVLAHAAAGEVGGAVASGSILGLIPVTLMLFAAMLMFKGSKQSSDEKAQAFQAQRGQQGVAEGDPGYNKHSFIGKIRRGREADNKGWGQLGNLFAADNEKDAEKALRKGNRYYNMTRGNNKTPGGFPKTTVEEQGVAEGTEQVYRVLAVDKSNALSKQVKLKVKASSLDEVFERLAVSDWYPLEINGIEVINGKRLKQGVAEGASDFVGDAIEALRSSKPGLGQEDFLDELYMYIENQYGQRAAEMMSNAGQDEFADWYDSYTDMAEDAVADFVARGGQIQHGKTHKPRKAEKWQGSSHIGTGRGGKAQNASGMGANTRKDGNKPVVSTEAAPKGWEGTVKAMKKHKEIDNPYALTNYMKNKGYKSHKKESVDPYFESLQAKLNNQTKK